MNVYVHSNGKNSILSKPEAPPRDRLDQDIGSVMNYGFQPAWIDRQTLKRQQMLLGINQMARRVVPLALDLAPLLARILIDMVPAARSSFNSLTYQLLLPLLRDGEKFSHQQEATFFSHRATTVVVNNIGRAQEAALTEVLAAEASHTGNESEAAALMGSVLTLTLRVMGSSQLLRPFLPWLLRATSRLIRCLHRYSPASRRLLRLVPTILRWTVASLQAAQRWGYRLNTALVCSVLAAQTRRLLGTAAAVKLFVTRNALIRFSTVATAS
jgi:hypothetical protein